MRNINLKAPLIMNTTEAMRVDDESPSVRLGSGLKPVPSSYVAGLLTLRLDMKRRKRDIYVKDINSNEFTLRLEGTKKLSRLLEADPRIGDLRPEDIRVLIGFLKHQEDSELQFYALITLTNVDANGGELIKTEALPSLMRLMKSKRIYIRMQVLITLGRIAYDFPESIKSLYQNGTLKVLQNLVVKHKYNDMMLRNCSTFFAIFCRGIHHEYLVTLPEIVVAIDIANCLLDYGRGYEEVPSQAMAALPFLFLSFLSCQALRQCDVTDAFYLGLISDADPSIVVYVLEVIKNFFACNSFDQMKWMMAGDILQSLYSLSHLQYKIVRFQVCRILELLVLRFGEDCVYLSNFGRPFRIVQHFDMLGFIVIKDLETDQEIEFARHTDNFFIKTPDGKYILSPVKVSVGPFSFSERVSKDVSFSELRWEAEVYTQKDLYYSI